MKHFITSILVFFVAATAVQARDLDYRHDHFIEPEFEDDPGPRRHTLTLQGGVFYLEDLNQPVLATNNFIFTDESDTAYGLEYLFHFNDYHAIGAQYFRYTQQYVEQIGSVRGEMDVEHIMFTYKGHFRFAKWFRPFINFSTGIAGVLTDNANADGLIGLNYGFGTGIYFPFSRHIGLTVEYRYIGGVVVDADDNEIDLGGDAIFGGLNIIF